jgi:hypothetical protein
MKNTKGASDRVNGSSQKYFGGSCLFFLKQFGPEDHHTITSQFGPVPVPVYAKVITIIDLYL